MAACPPDGSLYCLACSDAQSWKTMKRLSHVSSIISLSDIDALQFYSSCDCQVDFDVQKQRKSPWCMKRDSEQSLSNDQLPPVTYTVHHLFISARHDGALCSDYNVGYNQGL